MCIKYTNGILSIGFQILMRSDLDDVKQVKKYQKSKWRSKDV